MKRLPVTNERATEQEWGLNQIFSDFSKEYGYFYFLLNISFTSMRKDSFKS